MATDHDPRELREIATVAKQEVARNWASPNFESLADYILATVRDDDGEEQPDVTIGNFPRVSPCLAVSVDSAGVWLCNASRCYRTAIVRGRPTCGQFRDLCRGLGVTPEAATAETPG